MNRPSARRRSAAAGAALLALSVAGLASGCGVLDDDGGSYELVVHLALAVSLYEESAVLVMGLPVGEVAELELEGEQTLDLLSGDSTRTFDATRESRFEGGVSASIRATPALRFVAAFGGHSGGDWSGLAGVNAEPLSTGTATLGAFGLEFHDSRDPWSVRVGYALEHEQDAPEERAGALGLGLGWHFEGSILDFGLLHRTMDRDGRPNSYDDRLSVTFRGQF